MELKKELKDAREILIYIAISMGENDPSYNYLMNAIMYVDEAARIANGETRLDPKWLHRYADKCV